MFNTGQWKQVAFITESISTTNTDRNNLFKHNGYAEADPGLPVGGQIHWRTTDENTKVVQPNEILSPVILTNRYHWWI